MIDVTRICPCLGRHYGAAKQPAVERRVTAPALGPLLKVLELDAQNRSLNSIQTAVESLEHVMVLRLLAPITQHSNFRGKFGIACYHCPAFSVCAEIFAWVETKAPKIAETPRAAPFIFRSMRLASIFDHGQAVAASRLHDRIHVGRLAIQMHRQDRLCPGSNRALEFFWIQVEVT